MYEFFCEWCNHRRQGTDICLLAHNANFDMGMLDAEVQRLGREKRKQREGGTASEGGLILPLLSKDAGIASVVDTLQLFRSKKLWAGSSRGIGGDDGEGERLPRPSSFKQADVFRHVLKRPMSGAHNAMSDCLGLEDILKSDALRNEWRALANTQQKAVIQIQINI